MLEIEGVGRAGALSSRRAHGSGIEYGAAHSVSPRGLADLEKL